MSRCCSCCTSFTGELSCFKFWQSTQMGLDPKASKMENKEVPATHSNHISFVEWVYIARIYLHISFACIIILYMLLLYICFAFCYMYIVYSVLYTAVKCVRCTDIFKYNFWNVHVHLNYSFKSTHKICFLIGLPPMNPVVFGTWGKLRCAKMTELQRRAQMRLLLHFDAWVWQLQGRRARHSHAEAGGGPSMGGFLLHGSGKN